MRFLYTYTKGCIKFSPFLLTIAGYEEKEYISSIPTKILVKNKFIRSYLDMLCTFSYEKKG